MGMVFILIITMLLLAGIIILQMFLSKRESKWLGLVLPIVSFLFGFIYPFNMATPSEGITATYVVQMIIVCLISNIPTFILLAIYCGCRDKNSKNKP